MLDISLLVRALDIYINKPIKKENSWQNYNTLKLEGEKRCTNEGKMFHANLEILNKWSIDIHGIECILKYS